MSKYICTYSVCVIKEVMFCIHLVPTLAVVAILCYCDVSCYYSRLPMFAHNISRRTVFNAPIIYPTTSTRATITPTPPTNGTTRIVKRATTVISPAKDIDNRTVLHSSVHPNWKLTNYGIYLKDEMPAKGVTFKRINHIVSNCSHEDLACLSKRCKIVSNSKQNPVNIDLCLTVTKSITALNVKLNTISQHCLNVTERLSKNFKNCVEGGCKNQATYINPVHCLTLIIRPDILYVSNEKYMNTVFSRKNETMPPTRKPNRVRKPTTVVSSTISGKLFNQFTVVDITNNTKKYTIWAISLGSIASMLTVICLCCCCCKRRSRQPVYHHRKHAHRPSHDHLRHYNGTPSITMPSPAPIVSFGANPMSSFSASGFNAPTYTSQYTGQTHLQHFEG